MANTPLPAAGTPQRTPLCGRDDHCPACALCEVLAHNQERAWAKGRCGSLSRDYLKLVCDRESGHKGDHRGYYDTADDCLFWSAK